MEAATPGETARAEDPGLNEVREATEAVPPESVRRNGPNYYSLYIFTSDFR